MKRVLCVLLGLLLCAAILCACNGGGEMPAESSASAETASTPDGNVPILSDETPGNGEISVSLPDEPGSAVPSESSCGEDSSSGTEKPDLLTLLRKNEPDLATEAFLQELRHAYGEETTEALLADALQNGYDPSLWDTYTGNSIHVLRSLFFKEQTCLPNVRLHSLGTPGEKKDLTLVFGGDICFADNYLTLPYMQENGLSLSDCIAQPYIDLLQNADLAVLNNEFSISDRGSPMPGKMYTFRSKPENTALYAQLGVDLVSLANNHVYDFGTDAFLDTLDTLDAYGISRVGAGRDAQEAQRPLYVLIGGKKIAFVSATRAEKHIMTPEAGENTPGVFRCYDPERLLQVIRETKRQCDYVILLVHWGTEHSSLLEPVQPQTGRAYVDAGADLIVGAHAHGLQGIEYYKGKAILYNLGNFWFDDQEIETALAQVTLHPDGSETLRIFPGMTKECVTTYELGTELGDGILSHIVGYSDGSVCILQNGIVLPNEDA